MKTVYTSAPTAACVINGRQFLFTRHLKLFFVFVLALISYYSATAQNKIFHSVYDASSIPYVGPYLITVTPYTGLTDTLTNLNLTDFYLAKSVNETGSDVLLYSFSNQ